MGIRIAYGFDKRPSDFAHVKYDALYIDTKKTNRSERYAAIRGKMRKGAGDTIVLIAAGDLGAGKGLAAIKDLIADLGGTIVIEPKPEPEPGKPGRPPACELTADQRERFSKLWSDPATDGGYIVTKACEECKMDAGDRKVRHMMRQRLRRLFGARRK